MLQWKWNEPHKMHHLGGPTQSPLPPSRGSRGRPNNAETSEAGWNDEDDHIRIHRMVEQQVRESTMIHTAISAMLLVEVNNDHPPKVAALTSHSPLLFRLSAFYTPLLLVMLA